MNPKYLPTAPPGYVFFTNVFFTNDVRGSEAAVRAEAEQLGVPGEDVIYLKGLVDDLPDMATAFVPCLYAREVDAWRAAIEARLEALRKTISTSGPLRWL